MPEEPAETEEPDETETSGQAAPGSLPKGLFIGGGIAAAAAVIGILIWLRTLQLKKERKAREERMRARRRRLSESGVSMEEFDKLLKEKREKR